MAAQEDQIRQRDARYLAGLATPRESLKEGREARVGRKAAKRGGGNDVSEKSNERTI